MVTLVTLTSDLTSITDLDNHTEFLVVGKHVKILWRTEKRVNVLGFVDEFDDCESIPVIHGTMSYTNSYTGGRI